MNIRKGAKEEPDKSVFSRQLMPKKSFSGFSPNLFIGSFGYPFVNVGALSSEDKQAIDTPKDFVQNNAQVQDVIESRQSFINSKLSLHIRSTKGRFLEQLQDIAKSTTTLDSEVDLVKPIPSTLRFDQKSMPHGPSAMLKKLELTSNAKVKRKVESITSDTDVKATDAIKELGKAQVDEHQLTKLLSAGTLGKERKLVPTKWSITAVDDMRSRQLKEEIESYNDVHAHYFCSELMGNIFYVFFLPGAWSFELLEITFPNTIYNSHKEFLFSHDYEYPQGRKTYVQETAGAYYAARLAIMEYLKTLGQQGRVIILRAITPTYIAPLGVWIIREGVRKALQTQSKELENIKQELEKLMPELDKRLDAKTIIQELQLLKLEQKRLTDF